MSRADGSNFDVNAGYKEGPRGGQAAGVAVTGPGGNTVGRGAAVGPQGGVAVAGGVRGADGGTAVRGAAVGPGGQAIATQLPPPCEATITTGASTAEVGTLNTQVHGLQLG